MNTNVLKALINIAKLNNFQISEIYKHSEGGNKITNKGDRLEYFIKDSLCGCINEPDRTKVYNVQDRDVLRGTDTKSYNRQNLLKFVLKIDLCE